MGKKGSEGRSSKERDASGTQDTLQVAQAKRKGKSPTPVGLRSRSATPVRGRSSTPFSVYITQRSPTPTAWRSITPFLRRDEKEKTPFELGKDIKTQIVCNKAVLDKALVMDISEPEESQKPVRYITSDLSIIDRASVMDVSNVEVIYVVEEYEEEDEDIEYVEEKKSKKKSKKSRKSITSDGDDDLESLGDEDIEVDSADSEESDDVGKKGKKKSGGKKKDKKDKSPSPKLSLNLEIGGGAKASKKMFESSSAPKPPPKKTKLAIQQEEKAKAAAKAAEEARIKKEIEEKERLRREEEKRLQDEADAAAAAEAEYEYEGEEEVYEEEEEEETEQPVVEEVKEPEPVVVEVPAERPETPKEPDSDDEFIRPDPEDQDRWRRVGESDDIIVQLRKFSRVEHLHHSEKESDAEWKKRRLNARLPFFITFLQDRAVANGLKIHLSCAVDGPYEFIRWYKDDVQLTGDTTYRIQNKNNVLTIIILHAYDWHAGNYKCIIGNSNGQVASSCVLTVYQDAPLVPTVPSFKYLKELYNSRDDEITIECQVKGVPKPKVTWSMFCTPIRSGYKFTVLEEANGICKLMLYKPTIKDNGVYICSAENYIGSAQVSHTIEVGKHLETHVPSIFHAGDRMQHNKEIAAKKAIEAALQSKADSEMKRDLVEVQRNNGIVDAAMLNKYKIQFALPLRDRSVLEGSNLKLVCNVIGPNPTCTWLKNDKPIELTKNTKNFSFKGKAVLELSRVTQRANGTYKCIAKNDFCEISTECKLKINAPKISGQEAEAPAFEVPLKDIYLANEEDLIIDATVRGNPRPNVTWVKDSLPIVYSDRIVYNLHGDGRCELIINKPKPEDFGSYTCTALSKLGSEKAVIDISDEGLNLTRTSSDASMVGLPKKAKAITKSEEDIELQEMEHKLSIGTDPQIKDQLYFIARLVNRYVVENTLVKIQAIVGGPNPKCHWLKDGKPIEPSDNVKLITRQGLTMLKILKASQKDAGEYTIHAQNDKMEISSSASLHIYEAKISADVAPVFIKPLKDSFHLNSNELKLETALRGTPTPAVYWYRDGIPLEKGERYHIYKHKEGGIELIVDKPTSRDSGKYLVRAQNRAGVADISHYVAFEGRDSHIADNIHGVFHADKNLLKHKQEEGKDLKLVTFESSKQKKSETVLDPTPKQNLFFYASLSNRYVSENSNVKFQAVIGGPNPVFTWFKDGEELEHGDHIRILKRDTMAILKILHVTLADAGNYTIKVKNPFAEILSSAKLHVYKIQANTDVAPVFMRPLTHHYKLHNNELCLETGLRGQPTPQIWWYKDGTEIKNYGRFEYETQPDGTLQLIVDKPKLKDAGRYYVRAVNRAGSAEIAHFVKMEGIVEEHIHDNIHGVFHADKKMLKANPDDLINKCTRLIKNAKEEPEIVLEAASSEEEEESSEEEDLDPADPKRIKNIEKIIPLKAHEPSREKSKTPEPQPRPVVAVVHPTPQPAQPINIKKKVYFLNYLSNRTIKSGSNVQWVVNLVGPCPKIRWFLNGKRLTCGSDARFTYDDGAAVLILFKVKESQTGEVMLRVKGPVNEIETKCSLTVYKADKEITSAPTFTVGIKENYEQYKDILVLDCRVRGQPRPEIKWIKGIHPIESCGRYEQVDLDDGYSKLIISHPTEEDSGRYTCVAKNDSGENKIIHSVEFQGSKRFTIDKTLGFFHRNTNKPHLVVPLGNQTVQLGGTIAFTAEFVQSLSQIEVQWLHDREPLLGKPDVYMFMNRGLYTVVIMDVSFSGEGTYTCRARNSFGVVDSYGTADVIFSSEEIENPPIFGKRPPMEQKLKLGDTLSIPFSIKDDPDIKISLIKGYEDITNSERVKKEIEKKEEEDPKTTFIIENVEVTDTATYFVVARSSRGTDRLVVSVNVTYPKAK